MIKYLTIEGQNKLLDELEYLTVQRREDVADDLKYAVILGDLRENTKIFFSSFLHKKRKVFDKLSNLSFIL